MTISTDLTTGSRYLFDTSVFIGAKQNHSTARKLLWQARFLDVHVGYSILTEAEVWAGIYSRRFITEAACKELLGYPFRRYPLNVSIARRGGKLYGMLKNVGVQLPDCLIAATGEYYGLTVYSENSTHFEHFKQFSISVITFK